MHHWKRPENSELLFLVHHCPFDFSRFGKAEKFLYPLLSGKVLVATKTACQAQMKALVVISM